MKFLHMSLLLWLQVKGDSKEVKNKSKGKSGKDKLGKGKGS